MKTHQIDWEIYLLRFLRMSAATFEECLLLLTISISEAEISDLICPLKESAPIKEVALKSQLRGVGSLKRGPPCDN